MTVTTEQLYVGGTYWIDMGDGRSEIPIRVTSIGIPMLGVVNEDTGHAHSVNRDYLMRYGKVRIPEPRESKNIIFVLAIVGAVAYIIMR